MLHFKNNLETRKELAHLIAEHTGKRPVYTRAPLYTYEIGPYVIDRVGKLHVEEDDADIEVLTKLCDCAQIAQCCEEEEEPIMDTHSTEPTAQSESVEYHLSLPMAGHTGISLKNLTNMVYTRAALINKSVSSHFDVSETFVSMCDRRYPLTVEEFLTMLEKHETESGKAFEGILFSEEQIIFTGFAEDMTPEVLEACGKLICSMNMAAIDAKHILAKRVPIENERYIFRNWLIRIGMGGSEYHAARKVFMKNLSGHTAFRTEQDAEKAKAKAKQRKSEHIAQKGVKKDD